MIGDEDYAGPEISASAFAAGCVFWGGISLPIFWILYWLVA
jgi:hypothetical protein